MVEVFGFPIVGEEPVMAQKRNPEMVREGSLMFDILMNACVISTTLLEDGIAANEYRIEAHCTAFNVTATPHFGRHTVKGFIIHNYSKEAC